MSGVALPAALGVVPTVLTQTHVGYGWSVAFAGALVVLATALAVRRACCATRCCGSR